MELTLLIPDGVGVRNFVLGPFLREASAGRRVEVLHPIPQPMLPACAGPGGDLADWAELREYRDTLPAQVLRNALLYAQMFWARTRSMERKLAQPVGGSRRNRAIHGLTRRLGRAAATPRGILALQGAHCALVGRGPEAAHYRAHFTRRRPAVLFCTHQRPFSVLPPVLAARELGIPTATFIFSWDNLTSKGRIAAPFDHYLVWSELMRRDLLRFYPDVTPERVHVIGTPQFDPYADPGLLWSREEFCRRLGADPARPIISYTGGDTVTCPEDPGHLRILLDLVRAGAIGGNPQVLLRPAPVDASGRYEPLRRDYPELIFAPPAWVSTVPGRWERVIPLPADVQALANVTHHSDVNVNLASTMTIDFAIHDRPVVNVAFDVADPPLFGAPLWDVYYQYEHYRPVVELGAARFARSPEELAAHVGAYLADPALDREGRRRLVELQVGAPIGSSSRRIVAALDRIAAAGTSEGRDARMLPVL